MNSRSHTSQEWFLERGGKTYGPFSKTQIRDLLAQNRVRMEDHVWNGLAGKHSVTVRSILEGSAPNLPGRPPLDLNAARPASEFPTEGISGPVVGLFDALQITRDRAAAQQHQPQPTQEPASVPPKTFTPLQITAALLGLIGLAAGSLWLLRTSEKPIENRSVTTRISEVPAGTAAAGAAAGVPITHSPSPAPSAQASAHPAEPATPAHHHPLVLPTGGGAVRIGDDERDDPYDRNGPDTADTLHTPPAGDSDSEHGDKPTHRAEPRKPEPPSEMPAD